MTRTNRRACAFHLIAAALALLQVAATSRADTPAAGAAGTVTRDQILADLRRMADVQLEKLAGAAPLDWVGGALYAGVADLARVSPDPKYADALIAFGTQAKWTPSQPNEFQNADRVAIGQAFLAAYEAKRDPSMIEPLKATKLDPLAKHLLATVTDPGRPTWWWCDTLFMAPPAMAHASVLTGDPKYLDAMDKEWWKVTGRLYDRSEHLFWRDHRYIDKRATNGRKAFWSRGNGWVMAGLARVLRHMPKDHPSRPTYVELHQEMAAKLASLRQPDGLWRSSLLDPAEFPLPESSGTAFYCYSLAAGIDAGHLDRATYLPVVTKAWSGLLAARREDGLLGYVQGIGEGPGPTRPDGTQLYATGAFLMAGAELIKLAPFAAPAPPALPRPSEADTDAAGGPRAFARFVPERKDDVAWENDRIAFRVYGPALQRDEPPPRSGSGIDVWAKSTRRLVIVDWYQTDAYHTDHGEGLDFYKVGEARGCGGLGIWTNDKLHVSGCWAEHKILKAGPADAAVFRLTYAPWDAGNGRKVRETRTITLAAGSNLNRVESVIDSDDPAEMVVGIGISRRPIEGVAQNGESWHDKERGILGGWSAPSPKHGSIGGGVLVDPAGVTGFARDDLNDLVLIKVTPGKPFVYYTGACWSKGLDFKTRGEWEAYLKDFKRQ